MDAVLLKLAEATAAGSWPAALAICAIAAAAAGVAWAGAWFWVALVRS